MKTLHSINNHGLTNVQLGIVNYYHWNGYVKQITFYSDGKVEIDGRFSWAKWNNGDWLLYIKKIGTMLPLSKMHIKVEIK